MDYRKETITLVSRDGEEFNFHVIAGIDLRGKYEGFYYIVRPEEELDVAELEDDEALVFKVTRDRNGNDSYDIVDDDDAIEEVFKEYNKLLDAQ